MSLSELQSKVHVGKDKRNDFGGYSYRTAEGILAAIKAALPEGAYVTITDDIKEVAGQIFVTATAKVCFPEDGECYTAQGHALHPLTKKGMDPSQITGAASSYARKYALAGLMALDDGSVDPDAAKTAYEPDNSEAIAAAVKEAQNAETLDGLTKVWNTHKVAQDDVKFRDAVKARKDTLTAPPKKPTHDLGTDQIPY